MRFDDLKLVNYCHPHCAPLQNIMRLPENEAFALARRLAAENPDTTAFYRFADFHNYYPRRRQTDLLLYEAFVSRGGRPTQRHPLSFVLQGSEYLDDWFDHGIVTCIPLRCVSSEHVSFTFGDSMAVLEREKGFTMLTKDELAEAIAAHPDGAEGFLREIAQKYTYMEVQLWDDTACQYAEQTSRG